MCCYEICRKEKVVPIKLFDEKKRQLMNSCKIMSKDCEFLDVALIIAGVDEKWLMGLHLEIF